MNMMGHKHGSEKADLFSEHAFQVDQLLYLILTEKMEYLTILIDELQPDWNR